MVDAYPVVTKMRIASTNRNGRGGECAVRRNGAEPAPAIAVTRNAAAHSAAPNVVSNVLRSAVLEQYQRDRNGMTEAPTLERSLHTAVPVDEAPPTSAAPSTATPGREVETGTENPFSTAAIPLWKRIFDCALVFATAPIWLPVMIVIMLAVKLSSPGPVFYTQERIGYGGRRFMIVKLRTMKVNTETRVHESYFERLMKTDTPMTKLDANGDPRLIGCGRFLRAAGLDELPQLINVLRGDMSLVGPRPCTVHEFERYLPWQRERVNAPPGLTGYWQVNGKNKTTFSEMISMDIFYSKNMSLALDLAILGKTLPAVLGQVLESQRLSGWKSWRGFVSSAPQSTND